MVPKTSKVANPLCSIYSSAHNTHEEPNPLICCQTHVPTSHTPARPVYSSGPLPRLLAISNASINSRSFLAAASLRASTSSASWLISTSRVYLSFPSIFKRESVMSSIWAWQLCSILLPMRSSAGFSEAEAAPLAAAAVSGLDLLGINLGVFFGVAASVFLFLDPEWGSTSTVCGGDRVEAVGW